MITHVAILDSQGNVWSLPRPNRHHHVIHHMHAQTGDREACRVLLRSHTQGFVNGYGQFLDRRAAFLEAIACDQVLPPYNPTDPSLRRWDLDVDPTPRELFSEDLW
jgi:hypothetical protein